MSAIGRVDAEPDDFFGFKLCLGGGHGVAVVDVVFADEGAVWVEPFEDDDVACFGVVGEGVGGVVEVVEGEVWCFVAWGEGGVGS